MGQICALYCYRDVRTSAKSEEQKTSSFMISLIFNLRHFILDEIETTRVAYVYVKGATSRGAVILNLHQSVLVVLHIKIDRYFYRTTSAHPVSVLILHPILVLIENKAQVGCMCKATNTITGVATCTNKIYAPPPPPLGG